MCFTGRLFNSNNFATSAALAAVCAILSAILLCLFVSMQLRNGVQVVPLSHWPVSLSSRHARCPVRTVHAVLLQLGLHSGLPGITIIIIIVVVTRILS